MHQRLILSLALVTAVSGCAAPLGRAEPSATVPPLASPSPVVPQATAPGPTPQLPVLPSADPASVGTKQPIQRGVHIPTDQRVANYSSDPPSSGPHYERPSRWLILDDPLPNEIFVHNLEHGGVVVVYNELEPPDVTRLRGLVTILQRSTHPKVLLFPYPTLKDAKIAVIAWGWLLKLPEYDPAKIRGFVEAHYEGPDAPERTVP